MPAVAAPAKDAAGQDQPGQVVDRDVNTVTTVDGAGLRHTRVFPEPVNYRDDQGHWREIDRSLTVDSAGDAEPQSLGGDLSIPRSLGDPIDLSYEGSSIGFRLLGADEEADRDIAGTKAVFDGALAGVDATYAVRADGVKETLVLSSAASAKVFRYELTGDAALTAAAEGGRIVLRDASGAERFRIDAPLAWDSASPAAFSDQLELAVQQQAPGKWLVTLTPDAQWLADPARQYPVSVDPDFYWVATDTTRFHGANTDCYLAGGTQAGTSFCAASQLQVGYYNRPYASIFKFDVSQAIPANATVTGALFQIYSPGTTQRLSANMRLRTITADWNSTATWDVRKTSTPWTTKGGDVSTDPLLIGPPTTVNHAGYWYYWDAPLNAVKGWVAGTLPNNGLHLSTDAGAPPTTAYTFTSTEGDQAFWPALDVTWKAPDTTAPTAPTELKLSELDAQTASAWASVVAGTDPTNGNQIVSGVNRTELRYRRGTEPFSSWQAVTGDIEITGLSNGAAVELNARTIDNAGNVSAVTLTSASAQLSSNPAAAFDAQASEYVQQEYGYSATVAQQWVNVQGQSSELAETLGTDAATAGYYGGIWFENETRAVHVLMNNSNGMGPISAKVNAAGLSGSVQYHVQPHTEGQLLARTQDADTALAADVADGWVEVNYSPATGRVRFTVAAGASQAVRDRVALQASAGSIPTETIQSAEQRFQGELQACGSTYTNNRPVCDTPLRGGTWIYSSENGACTAAFVARSREADNNPYILTAGHCLKPPNDDNVFFTQNTGPNEFTIGKRHNHVFDGNNKGMDAGILGVSYPNVTKSKPWVFTRRSSTGSTGYNEGLRIGATRPSKEGQVLCIHGATSGSHCGTIPKPGGLGHRGGNTGRIRVCKDEGSRPGQTKGGDSGAPWVGKTAAGTPTANGIHIGIPKPGDKPCESEFQSVRAAAARLNVYVLTTGNEAITCAAGIKRNENGRCIN